MARSTGIRRQLSRELGFVVPLVRVKDNLALEPNCYRITIAGVIVGEDEIWPEDLLALDSGDLENEIPGRKAKDPRSEEHTSELQSLMRNSYSVLCLKKKKHIRT